MRKKLFNNRNIIVLIVVLFSVWLLFLDRNNILRLREVDSQINKLEQEIEFYKSNIEADSSVIVGLGDSAFVEKFARETFFLRAEGETLYIIK